jgi:hypothetical protein
MRIILSFILLDLAGVVRRDWVENVRPAHCERLSQPRRILELTCSFS